MLEEVHKFGVLPLEVIKESCIFSEPIHLSGSVPCQSVWFHRRADTRQRSTASPHYNETSRGASVPELQYEENSPHGHILYEIVLAFPDVALDVTEADADCIAWACTSCILRHATLEAAAAFFDARA